ncbi:MAG TPA: TMEM165/GDT1 family protein [Candidatus Obscuribacterales bacterium]
MKSPAFVTNTAPEVKPAPKEQTEWLESVSRMEPATSVLAIPQQQKQPAKLKQPGAWSVFSSTFLTIFLAEMGDKTQLATLLMSAESQSPWVVFAGASAALIATSLLGVLLGRWLARCLSPKTLEISAAALLLFISVLLLWDVVNI